MSETDVRFTDEEDRALLRRLAEQLIAANKAVRHAEDATKGDALFQQYAAESRLEEAMAPEILLGLLNDAERMDWLEANGVACGESWWTANGITRTMLRDAIDAAMEASR